MLSTTVYEGLHSLLTDLVIVTAVVITGWELWRFTTHMVLHPKGPPAVMSDIKVDIDADDKPANFPSSEEILIQWEARFALAQAADPRAHIRGVSLVDAFGEPYAWLKFGPTVTMSEARTQHYVA